MSFGDNIFDPSSYPQRTLPPLTALPQYDPYFQRLADPYYARLPVPPPPNAMPYPRITLRAEDCSASGPWFTGECKLVMKTEALNPPAYECKAMFMISYVPLNEWVQIPVSTCGRHPWLIIDSPDWQVVWDATGDCPVVEYTKRSAEHSNTSVTLVHGPCCELVVLPVEGSDCDSYTCTAYYTLCFKPLEDWKVADDYILETSAAARNGSQNSVKPIPAYVSPKTETEQFPHPTEVVPQPHEQKKSAPVDKFSVEPSMRGDTRELPTSGALFNASSTFSERWYAADSKNSKNVEGRVHNSNAFGKKLDEVIEPLAELSLGKSKTCTLLQNKDEKQSSCNDDPITELRLGNSISSETLTGTTRSTMVRVCITIGQLMDRVSQAQVNVAERSKSSAPVVNAESVTTTTESHRDLPEDSEKQKIPESAISISGKENLKNLQFHDLRSLLSSCVAAENKLRDTTIQVTENKGSSFLMPLDKESSDEYEVSEWDSNEEEDDESETDSTRKERKIEFPVTINQGNSVEMVSEDEDDCSDEEEEDYEDYDNETDSTIKEKETEFQAITGNQGNSVEMVSEDEDECSEWDSDEEEYEDDDDETDSTIKEKETEFQAITGNQGNSIEMASDDEDECSEWDSDEEEEEEEDDDDECSEWDSDEEEDYDDECSEWESDNEEDDTETDSTQKEKETEFEVIGNQGSSVAMTSDECAGWETDNEDHDHDKVFSEWEIVDE